MIYYDTMKKLHVEKGGWNILDPEVLRQKIIVFPIRLPQIRGIPRIGQIHRKFS